MYDEGLEPGVESNFFRSFLVNQNRYIVSGGASRGRKTKAQEMSDSVAGVTEKPALYACISVGICHEILLIAECSLDGEWEGQVRFLPLR